MAAEKIPLTVVTSRTLAAVGYNAEKQILAVQFRSGHIYHYSGIDGAMKRALYGATSIGHVYGTQIKGKFPAEKMTGLCPSCGDLGWIGDSCADCGCAPYAATPAPVRHALHPYEPERRYGPVRAECGTHVSSREIANQVDGITCVRCLAIIAERDAVEV